MLSIRYRPPETIFRNGDETEYVIRYTRVGSGVSEMIIVSSNSIDESEMVTTGSGSSGDSEMINFGSGSSDSGISEIITDFGSNTGLQTQDIPGLVAFTNYSVEVAAVNVNGTGPFSDPVYGLSGQDSE